MPTAIVDLNDEMWWLNVQHEELSHAHATRIDMHLELSCMHNKSVITLLLTIENEEGN